MPITNFTEITEDLSEEEMNYKDDVKTYLQFFLTGKKSNPVKQNDIVQIINSNFEHDRGPDSLKITTTRLRKYFNYFRTNGVLAIVATSQGCYISDDKQEIEKQILSLQERARQILRASEGMKKFLL